MNQKTDLHRIAVIFGGTGFVGCHYAQHLLENDPDLHVALCDLDPINPSRYAARLIEALQSPRCSFHVVDVRPLLSKTI